MHGADLVKTRTDGFDQAPSPDGGTQRSCSGSDEDDDQRQLELLEETACEQTQHHNAHGFLWIVGAMAECQPEPGDDLNAFKKNVDAHAGIARQQEDQPGEEIPHQETDKRGEEQCQ